MFGASAWRNLPLGLTYRCITSPVKFRPTFNNQEIRYGNKACTSGFMATFVFSTGQFEPINELYVFESFRCGYGVQARGNVSTTTYTKGVTQMVGFGLSI